MPCETSGQAETTFSGVCTLRQSKASQKKPCGKLISFITCLLFICSFCIFFTEASEGNIWPSHYTDAHLDLHKKIRDTTHGHLADFQVVVPSAVDENYHHVTHVVRHKRSSRVRRDVSGDATTTEKTTLRYTVSGFGHNFQFKLEPNSRLIAPTFYVKRVKRGAEEVLEKNDELGCHYHGRLMSHRGEMIAMSTCEGLTGILRTEDDDFLLEPIGSQVNHSFDAAMHPHILYKRQHLDKEKHRLHYCGKKRRHPVHIPSSGKQKIKLLSNGEIELEEVEPGSNRVRRSVEFPRRGVGLNEEDLNDFDISYRNRPRKKVVETLVVADRDMIRNHESDHRDVTTYVLTVMNMVSGLFEDHTLDGQVNMVLVGLMLMEDNEGLNLDHKADRSLSSFCRWQAGLNHSDGHGPDHSILLTGIDICVKKNSPCETLGLAQIGGMCSRRDSCTINEDMGLGLAFTVAHETGHSFGMRHDGQSNRCSKRDGHIMSPTLNGLNGVFTWSTCSREALSEFLGDIGSMCLDDHPSPMGKLNSPTRLPGEVYNAEDQCKWQFGINTAICGYRYEHKLDGLCKVLWCQREGSAICETKYMPAVEGTPCGNDKWCRRGVCVLYGNPGPQSVDGSWGEYGPLSTCTRSCGGGVQFRKRSCNNPAPQYGGRHCDGKDKMYQICNARKCPSTQVDFRGQQCAQFNKRPYRRRYFNWVPFTKYSSFGRDQCELLCKAERYDFFDMLADQVVDGTPCESTSSDVCIQGKCEHVGCDNVLGSNSTYDMCGVCNGDNSTCKIITGAYTDSVQDSGYFEVGRIPRGARSVKIWEHKCCTHSFIAIKSATELPVYFLNGNWQVDLYGPTSMAGAQWTYDRKAFQTESLFTVGPLLEDIIVEVLIVAINPGIRFSYTMQKIDNSIVGAMPRTYSPVAPLHSYQWNISYTDCSASCAGGTQAPLVSCMRDDMEPAGDEECDVTSRPPSSPKSCNTQSCPARWVISDWSECSRSCNGGLQTRQIACKVLTAHGDSYVQASECADSQSPASTQSCRQLACPSLWYTGPWSKCSHECGRGKKSRVVQCRSGLKRVRNSACDRSLRPRSRERCLITYCQRKYQWFITAWDQCSATCGQGLQQRELKCSYKKSNGQYRHVAARRCRRVRKPQVSLQKPCAVVTCPALNEDPTGPATTSARSTYISQIQARSPRAARWIAGSWQQCTVSCGGGDQIRVVKCLYLGQESNSCAPHRKPPNKRTCNTYKCSLSASNEQPFVCSDNFKWCYLVPQHSQCSHKYFGVQCCKTCSNAR